MATLYEKKLAKIQLKIEKLTLRGKSNYIEYSKLIDELVAKGDYSAFQECLHYYYTIDISNAATIDSIKISSWDEICFQSTAPFLKKLKKMYDKKKTYQVSYDIFSSDPSYIQILQSDPLSITYSSTNYPVSYTRFSLKRENGIVNLNVLDPSLHSVSIEKAIWGTESGVYQPIETTPLQSFYIGTQSIYRTEISTSVMSDYLITLEVRNDYGGTSSWYKLNNKVSIIKNSYLGQIKEVEVYTPDSLYYLKNKQYSKIVGTLKTYLEAYKADPNSGSIEQSPGIFAYNNFSLTEDSNLLIRYTNAVHYLGESNAIDNLIDKSGLRLKYYQNGFTNISSLFDITSLNNWNLWFDLPLKGSPFVNLEVNYNAGFYNGYPVSEIVLRGGFDIHVKDNLFKGATGSIGLHLFSFIDNDNCIVEIGNNVFEQSATSSQLEIIKIPSCTSIGDYSFKEIDGLVYLNIISCDHFGNNVFQNLNGSSLTTLVINPDKFISVGGYPDYNIQDLLYLTSNRLGFDGLSHKIYLGWNSTIGENTEVINPTISLDSLTLVGTSSNGTSSHTSNNYLAISTFDGTLGNKTNTGGDVSSVGFIWTPYNTHPYFGIGTRIDVTSSTQSGTFSGETDNSIGGNKWYSGYGITYSIVSYVEKWGSVYYYGNVINKYII